MFFFFGESDKLIHSATAVSSSSIPNVWLYLKKFELTILAITVARVHCGDYLEFVFSLFVCACAQFLVTVVLCFGDAQTKYT